MGGGFLENDILEIGVGFEAFGDEDYIQDVDQEKDDCWCDGVRLGKEEHEEDLDAGAD